MLENTFINVKNQSKTITAELKSPRAMRMGWSLAQGGRFGGWSLYMKDGKPIYTYNFLGLARYTVAARRAHSRRRGDRELDFVYDGGGRGKGGTATLSVNDKAVAAGHIEKTQSLIFSADETADIGLDNQTPVADDIGIGPQETRFTGAIRKVTVEVKEESRICLALAPGRYERNLSQEWDDLGKLQWGRICTMLGFECQCSHMAKASFPHHHE